MKQLQFIFMCCFFLTLSCSREEVLIEDQTNALEEVLEPSIINGFKNQTSSRVSTVPFGNTLQWASYITAQTILSDRNIRIEVFNLLNGREAIPLEELINSNYSTGGGNTSSPLLLGSNNRSDNSLFTYKFFEILTSIIESQLNNSLVDGSSHGMQTPPPPAVNCGCTDEKDVDFLARLFIQEILTNNCLELYMPESFNPFTPIDLVHSITSTSHPLNSNDFNEGIIHYSEPIFNGLFDVVSEGVDVVNLDYVTNTNNDVVIVVRPFRSESISIINEDPCNYPQYSGIDFTDFLDN